MRDHVINNGIIQVKGRLNVMVVPPFKSSCNKISPIVLFSHSFSMQPLLALVKSDTPAPFLRNVTWTISNLCRFLTKEYFLNDVNCEILLTSILTRNKNPSPPFEVVKQCLPCLAQLIQHQDREVCYCLESSLFFKFFILCCRSWLMPVGPYHI